VTRASLQTHIMAPVRFVASPIRSAVLAVIGLVDLVLDEIYWRFDLWSVPPSAERRGLADHSKVRGFCAFWIAAAMDLVLFFETRSVPGYVALLAPISLLAYSFGERTFIAFIKALPGIVAGWRGAALDKTVEFPEAESRVGE
jgi:hypothetical protein